MSENYREYWVFEADFGSSTSFSVKYVDGNAVDVIDTSTNDTNYVWDCHIEADEYLGKSIEVIEHKLEHYFDDFGDRFRHPSWIMDDISSDKWLQQKAEQTRNKVIEKAKEDGVGIHNQRYRRSKDNKDPLAVKAEELKKAREGALNRARREKRIPTNGELTQAQIKRYKELRK